MSALVRYVVFVLLSLSFFGCAFLDIDVEDEEPEQRLLSFPEEYDDDFVLSGSLRVRNQDSTIYSNTYFCSLIFNYSQETNFKVGTYSLSRSEYDLSDNQFYFEYLNYEGRQAPTGPYYYDENGYKIYTNNLNKTNYDYSIDNIDSGSLIVGEFEDGDYLVYLQLVTFDNDTIELRKKVGSDDYYIQDSYTYSNNHISQEIQDSNGVSELFFDCENNLNGWIYCN